MNASTIDAPRAPQRRKGSNFEKWGWLYMRVSGVLLVVLIFGHLFVNLMLGDGISACSTSASSPESSRTRCGSGGTF